MKGKEALVYIEKRLGYPMKALLAFPKFFLIETTNICNARCVMCGIDFDKKKKAVISDELFNKIADEIGQHKDRVEKVMLYLDCEPLLDNKLASRIRRFKKSGIKKVNIASNASLLDAKKATELIDAGLDEIYITIDSLKKDVFEKIRPGLKFEAVYNNTINFIRLRNKLNPKFLIRIQMILQELNHNEADYFIDHWKPLLNANDQVVVQKAHNWGSQVDIMKFGDENAANDIPCIALWGTFCFHVDGEAALCCMDTNTKVSLGNLNSQTISEIWNGDKLKQIREKHISGKRADISICDGCTLWREAKHEKELWKARSPINI